MGRLVGQGAIFAGGLAIGSGVMMLRRGESVEGRPGMMIIVGAAFLLFSIFSNLFAKEFLNTESSTVRG